jgi:hypothetical protein
MKHFFCLVCLALAGLATSQAYAEDAPPSAPSLLNLLPKTHELRISRDFEGGVVDRMLVDYFGRYWLSDVFALDAGVGTSFFAPNGVSLLGVSAVADFPNAHSFLALGVEHERWPAWQVTENRVVLYWNFHPLDDINISFGAGYRSPQFVSTTFAQSLAFGGPSDEFSVLYRFDWRVLQVQQFGVSAMIWNYDHMRLYTVDNIHFSLRLGYALTERLALTALGTASINGLSGGILSWGQSQVVGGITYGP